MILAHKKTAKYYQITEGWAKAHLSGLFLFNVILIVLVLLSNAGYFKPYFFLGINLIVFSALVLSVFLLGSKSNIMFIISIIFWLFCGLLKVLKIDIWAERSAIYAFQSLFLGMVLLFCEFTLPGNSRILD